MLEEMAETHRRCSSPVSARHEPAAKMMTFVRMREPPSEDGDDAKL
jgi:hypothetical protein